MILYGYTNAVKNMYVKTIFFEKCDTVCRGTCGWIQHTNYHKIVSNFIKYIIRNK